MFCEPLGHVYACIQSKSIAKPQIIENKRKQNDANLAAAKMIHFGTRSSDQNG
jgi:hypothetical protein